MRNKNNCKLPNIVKPGFVAPDGGWGWMIVIAAGFSNFCTLSLLLAFGLLFRERFEELGINLSQTTTITNFNTAVMSCVGLSNGPLYRRFSCRQVCCVGTLVCTLSICALSFMETFHGILLFFSVFYAIGNSLAMTSCALALNTYFKKKRRIAVGLSWTCTGLGPIVVPQLVTFLLPLYDVSGTLLLFGGITFNAFACALLLQPVSRHVKKKLECQEIETRAQTYSSKENDKEIIGTLINESSKALPVDNIWRRSKVVNLVESSSSQRFGSQCLYYDDEHGATGLDVVALGTPMMSRANDGWFAKLNASNTSLAPNKADRRDCSEQIKSRPHSVVSNKQSSFMVTNGAAKWTTMEEKKADHINDVPQTVIVNESSENTNNYKKANGKLPNSDDTTESLLGQNTSIVRKKYDKQKEIRQSSFMRALHAIVVFFDLDLLKDPVYVNLMIGVTLVNFADLNFFLLSPFILADCDLKKADIANLLSIIAIVDVITRLLIPFTVTRIGWENRIFYMMAMAMMITSRILLAHGRTYNVLLATGVLIGAAKGFRQVFVALVIPTHVSLERLPAANGLQLATAGIIHLTCGPIVGLIRDIYGDYSMTLHTLNFFAYFVMTSWILEISYFNFKNKHLNGMKETSPSGV